MNQTSGYAVRVLYQAIAVESEYLGSIRDVVSSLVQGGIEVGETSKP